MSNPRDYLDSSNATTDFVEGRLISHRAQTSSSPLHNPTFKKMVILDVVSDPINILNKSLEANKKVEYWRNVLKVSNMKFATVLPRNTIIGHFIHSNENPMFAFPFFPSHFAFPCKPGETVWVMVEDPDMPKPEIVYWMCRVTELHHADDINHTHSPRSYDISFSGIDRESKQERSKNDGKTNPFYELRNGNVLLVDGGSRRIDRNNLLVQTSEEEDYFEKLIKVTDAARLMQYESIPRFKKRPGDIALEGTNNSLIVLGTDRTTNIGTYAEEASNKSQLGPVPSFNEKDIHDGDSGSIDLVVGRGQTKETFGEQVSTTSIIGASGKNKGKELKKELGKSEDQLSISEGDLDLKNDRSRIQISQRTKVDTNFGLVEFSKSYSSGEKILGTPIEDDKDGDAAIVLKTDKIRLIARSDIEIIVTGYEKVKNAKNFEIKNQNESLNTWASVVIKSNGDIVFKPSSLGYIKLGGDDANLGIVCSDAAVTANNGTVVGSPLITTMGGQFAGSKPLGTGANDACLAPGQAKFASKVLIK